MSLIYKVLWIDDNKDDYKKEEKALKKFIEDLFFEPKIDFCEDIASAKEYIDSEKYDVIFSDYNIDEERGNDFISYIREKSVNTEVLFYSGQNQLPEGRLDRVTFFFGTGSHREERLLKKMKDLISLTIEKLNDLTQLRGLVMAEVSELDNRMENLIADYFLIENDEERTKRRKLFDDTVLQHIEDKTKDKLKSINCETKTCQLKLKNKDLNKIVQSIDFDSSYKAYTIDCIMKELSYPFNQGAFKDVYVAEINQKRNDLAHSYSEIENGEEILKTKKHGSQKFTKDDIADIRRDIKKYHLIFNELYKLIVEKNREISG